MESLVITACKQGVTAQLGCCELTVITLEPTAKASEYSEIPINSVNASFVSSLKVALLSKSAAVIGTVRNALSCLFKPSAIAILARSQSSASPLVGGIHQDIGYFGGKIGEQVHA